MCGSAVAANTTDRYRVWEWKKFVEELCGVGEIIAARVIPVNFKGR
jgi:hypothetical protein